MRPIHLLISLPLLFAFECEPSSSELPPQDPDVHCVVLETHQRRCTDCCGDTSYAVTLCQAGADCVAPPPRNVDDAASRCVDTYRYQTRAHAASCEEIEDFIFGRLECLEDQHCSGDPREVGDWHCTVARRCECPVGGNCPPPLPPGAGAGGTDAGGADAGLAPVRDASAPDAGASGGAGGAGGA